jgi:hypothetical protein
MNDFGEQMTRLMAERGIGVRELGRTLHFSPGHVADACWRWRRLYLRFLAACRAFRRASA